jgi:O-antigen ligase
MMKGESTSTCALAFAALLALAAIAWGGATTTAAQAAILVGLALLWLFAPARRSPGRGFVICACGLVALAALAWLPVGWVAVEPWRRGLQDVGIALPATLSPQPWLSLEAMLWLVVGLVWVAWLMGQNWERSDRARVARILAGGMVGIASVALIAWALHRSIPGWLSERGFGPFPNRNHTGHVFALGGVLALGCAADAGRRDWRRAIPWLIGAAVLLVALVVNYSRGGLLVFFGAVVLWAGLWAWQRKSWKSLALGASLVLMLTSLVLAGGGAFAGRFAGGADSQVAFRTWIWRDTLALIHASPWCGTGLGNFTAVFPFFRSLSVNQQSVLHPESDWLWLASEMGWGGVALALGAVFFVLRDVFPLAPGSRRILRAAAFAAAIAALLHCAIDVPGHRLGSGLMALLVMVLARGNGAPATPSRVPGMLFRAFGLLALGAAAALIRMPDEAGAAQAFLRANRFSEAEAAANRAILRAPLDWRMYFTRAGARGCAGRTLEALADFRRARTLEPHYIGLPFDEGHFWLQSQPMLALTLWREALRRAHPPDEEELYGAMLADAPDNEAFRAQLFTLVSDRPALQLQWFRFAPPSEARAQFEVISASAGHLTPAQRTAFHKRAEEIGLSTSLP